jgi:hypothetical protein
MLPSILATAVEIGPVTGIRSPKGYLSDLLAELPDDLVALAVEGDDPLLYVEAGGRWWPYGGLV